MAELTQDDLNFYDRIRVNEQDVTGSNGFSLKFIPKLHDQEIYLRSADCVNNLINAGLVKVLNVEKGGSVSYRHATPTEIVEWKQSGQTFDIYEYAENLP